VHLLLAGDGAGLLTLCDGGRRLEGDAQYDRLPVGDAALDPAGVVRGRPQPVACKGSQGTKGPDSHRVYRKRTDPKSANKNISNVLRMCRNIKEETFFNFPTNSISKI